MQRIVIPRANIDIEIVYKNVSVTIQTTGYSFREKWFKDMLSEIVDTIKSIGDEFEVPKEFTALGDKK